MLRLLYKRDVISKGVVVGDGTKVVKGLTGLEELDGDVDKSCL